MADHLVAGLHCAEIEDLAASFVLGALEPAEADAVRTHLAGCPEAHAEFAELGSVVPALLESIDVMEPPSALRDRIRYAAAAEAQSTPATSPRMTTAPARPAEPRPAEPRRLIELPSAADSRRPGVVAGLFRRPVWTAIGLAAALALVALGAWNVRLQDDLNGLTVYRNGVAAVLDQAARPGAQLAVLSAPGDPNGPTGIAAVAADGSVALVVRDLKPTAGAQVYEAWVIVGDAAPVPIGGFQVDAGGAAWFATPPTALGEGVTVALTLESGPDAKTPTLPIIAAGSAS